MNKLFLPLAVASIMCSACSPLFYQQIATLSSENVNLKDDGSYAYEDGVMTIEYDFWAESGQFKFKVSNNSDDDIYLNLAESYFIDNGYAHDYYQARSFVYSSRNSAVSGLVGATAMHSVTMHGFGAINSLTLGKVYDTSLSSAVSTSVEIDEKPIICIPAHSFKVFEEFSVAESVFRECGFVRDPSKRENAVREFNGETSPKVIENRLVFKIGEATIPVTNIFHVSQYQNISTEATLESVKVERCDGKAEEVRIHKLSAKNKFYITYNTNELYTPSGIANDRKESFHFGY